ncbi:MAG TPA: adenylate/guanylate cyclase domain-containing protein [Gaiellaceae bacterium]
MASEARKTVTVVFTDVTGSTSLGDQLDPEPLRAVMARYFETAQTVLERHGGTVEKFIGDAVMAVFGVPTVHEDDALRAVRAAAELRDELAGLNEELERERGVSIALRTGVNTGEVVAGDPAGREFFATGDAVNVAARLEQAAEPGEILIGETTRLLVRDAVELEPGGELDLKGKASGVPAWRLRSVRPGAPTFTRRLESPLVGRRAELERLIEAYDEARDTRAARLCTVVGAAGVGKTRLTAELARCVGGEATVIGGRCLSYGEGITYWPLVDIVRQAEEHFTLAELVPERALALVAGLVGRGEAAANAEESFWAVRKLFEALAGERPLVVVFDDVHWAEPTLLDLIEHVLEFTADVPLLLAALGRPELVELRPLWTGRQDDRTLVQLEPLDAEESAALVDLLAADIGLPADARRRVAAGAAGNPLFLEQMLAMLAEHELPDDGHPVPPTIQALLAARIDELTAEERVVVEPAAVVGQEFWREAIVALCPAEVGVSAALQRLARRELIARAHSTFAEDAFRFRHLLIRDAAYATIPKERRAELHRRFAEWLEDVVPEYGEIVGYHFEQAYRSAQELGPLGEDELELGRRASRCLASAGALAWSRGDASGALGLLERARAVFPPGERRPTELLVALGAVYEMVGRLEEAEELLSEGAREAAVAGDRRAELRLRVESALIRYAHSDDHEGLEALVQEALTVFEEVGDDGDLAAAWMLASYPSWVALRAGEQAVTAERALAHARRAGDSARTERMTIMLMFVSVFGEATVDDAKTRVEQLLAEAEPGSLLEASGFQFLGWLVAAGGEMNEGRALYRRGLEWLIEVGALVRRGGRAQLGAEIELFRGDLAAAEQELRGGYEALAGVGEKGLLSTISFELADVLYQQGKYAEAEEFTNASEEASQPADISAEAGWRAVRAKIHARRGELEAAERLSAEALRLIEPTDSLTQRAQTLVSRAEVLRLAGKPDEAVAALEEAARLYEAKGVVPAVQETRALLRELERAERSE